MAFEVLDEHEQGELVQKWLRENVFSIAIGIGIGLLALFGYRQWQSHTARTEVDAAGHYQALVDAVDAKHAEDADKLAAALRSDYAGTTYAVLAALRQADEAVGKGDLKAAADALDWATANTKLPALKELASLRLAEVRLAGGDADAALKLIDVLPKSEYPAVAAELRGDALAKLGRSDDARTAYQDALANIDPRAPTRSFVQMKLDELAPITAPAVVPAPPTEKPASPEKQGVMKPVSRRPVMLKFPTIKFFGASIVVLGRTALTAGILALSLGGCTWLKSLGKSDNVEPPTELTEFTPTLHVDRLWSEGSGGGSGKSGARVQPAVVDGHVYVAGVDGTISALDAASGNKLWSKHVGTRSGFLFWKRTDNTARWSGGPSVQGDLVVVGGLDGQVEAFAATDGSERWTVDVSSEVIAPPAIADGIVVVRTNDGRLHGLDGNDGSSRWVFDQSVPVLSLRGNSAPVIANGTVYTGFDNGKVIALKLADGSQVWTQTISVGEGRTEVDRLADVDGSIVLDNGELFAAGYRGQVAAMSAENGRQSWQRDLSSYAGVAANSTTVVVVASDGNVWAFDRSSGANLWKQDKLQFRWLSPPAIVGNTAVVGDLDGYVHWMSLDDGKLVARERLGKKPIESAPVVVDNTAYIMDVKGNLTAYRVAP